MNQTNRHLDVGFASCSIIRLTAYRVALGVLAQIEIDSRSWTANMRDQSTRAAESVVNNLAEVAPGEAWEEEA
jgi:hypothetical protein